MIEPCLVGLKFSVDLNMKVMSKSVRTQVATLD